jgi:D-alanine-D-alanine ligase
MKRRGPGVRRPGSETATETFEPGRVVIAYGAVAADADPSTSDVLDQVRFFEQALDGLGVAHTTVAVAGGRVWEHAGELAGALVCNLLEAPPGQPQLHAAATAALELLGVPFTGSSAAAMWLTTDKLATRALLAANGLPVAAGGRFDPDHPTGLNDVPLPWILKPAWEDASVGLEGEPVASTLEGAVSRARALVRRFPGQPILAERFLPGREFNVSLLERDAGVEVLPVAEIVFDGFPAGTPALVGYEAKWETGSFADTHTVRRFPGEADEALVGHLRTLAAAAWDACAVSGYARVDLRLDDAGRPAILEVNANPCLSPDAGFIAAARQAGIAPAEVAERILAAARRRHLEASRRP